MCLGATVHMVCRNPTRGEDVKQEIISKSNNEVCHTPSLPTLPFPSSRSSNLLFSLTVPPPLFFEPLLICSLLLTHPLSHPPSSLSSFLPSLILPPLSHPPSPLSSSLPSLILPSLSHPPLFHPPSPLSSFSLLLHRKYIFTYWISLNPEMLQSLQTRLWNPTKHWMFWYDNTLNALEYFALAVHLLYTNSGKQCWMHGAPATRNRRWAGEELCHQHTWLEVTLLLR